jgi:YgiT-type zinc finger domain-containing protein
MTGMKKSSHNSCSCGPRDAHLRYGCPEEHKRTQVTHTVRHRGRITVIDHVPADVCSVCGDVLFEPETLRRIERLLADLPKPTESAPLY